MAIEWIEKDKVALNSRSSRSAGIDVRVVLSTYHRKSDGQELKRTDVIFYNNADKKITHTDYLVCGVSANRLYFKEEYLKKGYKVQHPKKVQSAKVSITQPLEKFEGLYILEFDRENELWYISTDSKIGVEEI